MYRNLSDYTDEKLVLIGALPEVISPATLGSADSTVIGSGVGTTFNVKIHKLYIL